MARQKGSTPRQHITPTRLQDGTGLEDKIAITIVEEFIAPLEVRIETLEADIEALLAGLARFTATRAVLELPRGRRGGTTYIEPEADFDDDTIGRPVIIVQADNGDRDEFGIVKFTGDVMDRRKLRVRWHAEHGAPRRVEVVYLIG